MTARMEGHGRLDKQELPAKNKKLAAFLNHSGSNRPWRYKKVRLVSFGFVIALTVLVLVVTAGAQWFGTEWREENRSSNWGGDKVEPGPGVVLECQPGNKSVACQAVRRARMKGPQIILQQPADSNDVPPVTFD